jgi:hypothetical protein
MYVCVYVYTYTLYIHREVWSLSCQSVYTVYSYSACLRICMCTMHTHTHKKEGMHTDIIVKALRGKCMPKSMCMYANIFYHCHVCICK